MGFWQIHPEFTAQLFVVYATNFVKVLVDYASFPQFFHRFSTDIALFNSQISESPEKFSFPQVAGSRTFCDRSLMKWNDSNLQGKKPKFYLGLSYD